MNFHNMEKNKMKKLFLRSAVAFLLLVMFTLAFLSLHGCNVTRTITNESQYFQRGDTSVLIQTKTIETYDASRKQ